MAQNNSDNYYLINPKYLYNFDKKWTALRQPKGKGAGYLEAYHRSKPINLRC